MKHIIVALVLLCLIIPSAFSQTLREALTNPESPVTYLGIDFSKTKLLDVGNPEDIKGRLYASINQVVVNEPKKYDLAGAFHKTTVPYDFAAVTKSNEKADVSAILSTSSADFNRFKESDVITIVKGLDLSGKTGVGVLFVAEALRKSDKKGDAAIWVTYVDMKTKKVLLTERIESKGKGGIGFRNFWVSTIKTLLDDIEKNKFKEWQAKYGR